MPSHFITRGGAHVITREFVSHLVFTKQEKKVFLTRAQQGPPGIPGQAGSILHTGTAAISLGGHRAVIATAAGMDYASNDNASHSCRVAGITVAAAIGGSQVNFQSSGKITEPSWTWTPDGDIWLGTDGLLTQVYPAGAAFAQLVGYAINSATMWVDLGDPTIQ